LLDSLLQSKRVPARELARRHRSEQLAPLKPRSRSLTGPMWRSNTAVSPSTRSASRTASTPAHGVSHSSATPTRTRRTRCRFPARLLPRILATEQVPFHFAACDP
jgi:hypothetical protein